MGQALVEFALVVPLILIVIFGIIDFGAAYNYQNDITHLANEAARYAAVSNCGYNADSTPCTSIEDAVKADADSGALRNGAGGATGPDQPLVVCLDFPPGSDGSVGSSVRATVETNYRWLPYLNLATVRLYAQATMRVEQANTGVYSPVTLTGSGNCPSYVP